MHSMNLANLPCIVSGDRRRWCGVGRTPGWLCPGAQSKGATTGAQWTTFANLLGTDGDTAEANVRKVVALYKRAIEKGNDVCAKNRVVVQCPSLGRVRFQSGSEDHTMGNVTEGRGGRLGGIFQKNRNCNNTQCHDLYIPCLPN